MVVVSIVIYLQLNETNYKRWKKNTLSTDSCPIKQIAKPILFQTLQEMYDIVECAVCSLDCQSLSRLAQTQLSQAAMFCPYPQKLFSFRDSMGHEHQ